MNELLTPQYYLKMKCKEPIDMTNSPLHWSSISPLWGSRSYCN